jgi:hypothetical protein
MGTASISTKSKYLRVDFIIATIDAFADQNNSATGDSF